jgi:hypothetical protein
VPDRDLVQGGPAEGRPRGRVAVLVGLLVAAVLGVGGWHQVRQVLIGGSTAASAGARAVPSPPASAGRQLGIITAGGCSGDSITYGPRLVDVSFTVGNPVGAPPVQVVSIGDSRPGLQLLGVETLAPYDCGKIPPVGVPRGSGGAFRLGAGQSAYVTLHFRLEDCIEVPTTRWPVPMVVRPDGADRIRTVYLRLDDQPVLRRQYPLAGTNLWQVALTRPICAEAG